MTYDEALAYWYEHVNYEQRTAEAADLGLERMRNLLHHLGNPHRRLRIVHVAGSKGKGSTSAMLAAVLQKAGYRTGLFTSPHLCNLEERFQVDREPITPLELTTLLDEIRQCIESASQRGRLSPLGPPTFFEIATAVGFLHFVRRRVETAVIEVGLGGRLDSTNVCDPLLSVITSISYDHTRILGDKLASIAREKAGIVKPGRPVISGVRITEARVVIEEVSARRRAPLHQLDFDFHFATRPGRVEDSHIVRPRIEVVTSRRRWPEMELNLLGEHQAENAAVAIAGIEELRLAGLHIPDEAVTAGLREVYWPARMELVGRLPLVVLDCAHNVASAAALAKTLADSFPPSRRVLLFAGSSDKDVVGMFRILEPCFSAALMTRYTNNPRAVAPEQLVAWWSSVGSSPAQICTPPIRALQEARQEAGPDGLLCIAGSVFLAGELRPHVVVSQQSS